MWKHKTRKSPGYALVTRGIAYVCRIISMQYGKEYNSKHYEKMKKTYSIWIIPNSNKNRDGLIRTFQIKEGLVQGTEKCDPKDYDKICIVEIYTSSTHNVEEKYGKWDSALMPINILLNNRYNAKKKIELLKDEYQIDFQEKEEEMNDMWSFSDMYIEQGIVLGKEQGIVLGKEQGIVLGKEQGIVLGKEQGIVLGKEQGMEQEKEKNILKYIKNRIRKNISRLEIKEDLMDIFDLSSQESDEYLSIY